MPGPRYFQYDSNTDRYVRTGRPNNQSSRSVRRRIVERMREAFPSGLRRGVTRNYLAGEEKGESLSAMSIDIAHVISAEEIGSTIASYMDRAADPLRSRNPFSLELDEYAAGLITTDAEDENEVRAIARRATASRSSAERRAHFGGLLWRRINRSRGNLAGGDSSANRGIGQRRDIPTLSDGTIPDYIQKRLEIQDEAHSALGTSSARFAPRANRPAAPSSSTF
jgi:hypothetical protein